MLPRTATSIDPTPDTPPRKLSVPPSSTRSSFDNTSERSRSKDGLGQRIDSDDEALEVVLQSFLPRVLVSASADTEELVRLKGISGGFCSLLRPFGETVQGNVVIRDSFGSSSSWKNYGVHFITYDDQRLSTAQGNRASGRSGGGEDSQREGEWNQSLERNSTGAGESGSAIDEVMLRYLREANSDGRRRGIAEREGQGGSSGSPTYFAYYLRRLLYRRSMAPSESFTHPVACVIAVSSQNGSPIEALRDLYGSTSHGGPAIPGWAGGDFLRYYVLVHDEDNDDITISTALFNQMKRHFGLHCHLLRLRSVECGPQDDDGTSFEAPKWRSPEEEISEQEQRDLDPKHEGLRQYLFDTDIAVIRTFVREMVTQSVVPFLEGRVTTWNDQVGSRRRGISGRLMSLSRKWTGFGSAKGFRANASSSAPSGTSFDPNMGAYTPESSEALLHRLADFAFMLRDWKLASSTYDMLRADFGDDKAWDHYAMANEMAGLSLLLSAQSEEVRPKTESIDVMLDTASYSYITRCSNTIGAIRCLTLAVELYRCIGGASINDAAKWADRLLELTILSPLKQAILLDRLARCYTSRLTTAESKWRCRTRRSLFWNVLGHEAWISLYDAGEGPSRLQEARKQCSALDENGRLVASQMNSYLQHIQKDPAVIGVTPEDARGSVPDVRDVERQELDEAVRRPRSHSHRLSVLTYTPAQEPNGLTPGLNNNPEETDDGFD